VFGKHLKLNTASSIRSSGVFQQPVSRFGYRELPEALPNQFGDNRRAEVMADGRTRRAEPLPIAACCNGVY
jgi:hypothetical protein